MNATEVMFLSVVTTLATLFVVGCFLYVACFTVEPDE